MTMMICCDIVRGEGQEPVHKKKKLFHIVGIVCMGEYERVCSSLSDWLMMAKAISKNNNPKK